MDDISQRLAEAESKYRLLAENLVDAIWVVDARTLRYLYVSPSVKDLRGYSAAEVTSQSIADHVSPECLGDIKAVMAEELVLFQKGVRRKRRLEVRMRHKDGHLIWVEIIARLFQQGPDLNIIGVTRDIDQRKKLELEREELNGELARALQEEKRLRRENRVLRGLLPICASCNRIRDEQGQWHDLVTYIESHSQAEFTHTICPACAEHLYPELKGK